MKMIFVVVDILIIFPETGPRYCLFEGGKDRDTNH
jgi:hypothetical protein